jgi:hypothetical protein
MPANDLTLPTGETVRLVYLVTLANLGTFIYLQSKRSGRLLPGSHAAQVYQAIAPTYAAQLNAHLKADNAPYQAVASPASSSTDAEIYRHTAKPLNLPDLSAGFSRQETFAPQRRHPCRLSSTTFSTCHSATRTYSTHC